jgi:hypothetical protein
MLNHPGFVLPMWVFAVFFIIATTSCQALQSSSEPSKQDVLVPMTTEEIVETIAGNSELWLGHGAGYYQEDGSFFGNWDGREVHGSWRVENDVRCYDVEEWGGEWCHEFYRQGEIIVLKRVGTDTILPIQIEEGNRL